MKIHPGKTQERRGTAAVELAVCLPFLLVVVFGIWEVGRMVQVQELVANAAREGGRQAAAGQTSSTAIRQYVVSYLNRNGLTGVDISMVTLTNLTTPSATEPSASNQLDQFRVTVTVPYSTVRWSTVAQITSTSTLTASSDWFSMRNMPVTVSNTIPTN
ncbi:MAG: pilus assembly protein [Planctomycetes bacterium]|nr:pilus assembly protein [Planctomycetota bacterium]